MDGCPDIHLEPSPGAVASSRLVCRRIRAGALPSELTFWALWHCRHARPPDNASLR
ncbi:hypothetical protein SAMN05216202_3215 [Pseudomonas mucidolens]|uniref:Uncharacterized protein n=1 Tax=Pseudomonas mucidolens TaxID=46679 RepID=A0A1H2N8E1_9PSED|nr:hypothetical protein SAMN05216202_3215 [Pseudomonas mucidolens]